MAQWHCGDSSWGQSAASCQPVSLTRQEQLWPFPSAASQPELGHANVKQPGHSAEGL